VSDRSLRRQLREQGISFRGLPKELRMQIVLKYLRTARLAKEDSRQAPAPCPVTAVSNQQPHLLKPPA
jgi:hypothetical protein